MIPAMTAVYRAIPPAKISDGTTQVNVLNRLGGSTGTAVFTVVLQHALASRGRSPPRHPRAPRAAYGDAFRWVLGAAILAGIPALILARAERRPAARPADLAAPSTPPTAPAPAPPRVPSAGQASPRG